MYRRTMPSRWPAVLVALAVLAAGCASDETSTTPAAETTEVADSVPTTLSGSQICERLTVPTVTADLGLDVAVATPDDSTTPRCTYEYVVSEGLTSTLTVAAVRPEDAEGLTGSDAFDATVAANRPTVGDGVDEQTINAGDHAVRLTGSLLHVGVLDVNDRIYVLTVPVDDAEPDGIDRLVASMATTLG
jgi:hypothetical protein